MFSTLNRRRRPATGAAVLLLMLLTAGGAQAAAPVTPAATAATASAATAAPMQVQARELLKELVDTNTTHAFGSTAAVAALAKRFRAAGFAAEDVVELAPPDHPTKGNLVVRLRGSGTGRPILYLGHLDVVEARREDWSFDPFRLTERDGWLYGRGVIDMKGQDAAMAAALMALKREGFRPARDLIVAFTADEEAGGDANGVEWLFATHRPLVEASLVINPDGGEAGMKSGRRLYVGMQTSEKAVLTFELETTDKGGHSSRPTADNPIYRLAIALTHLAQLRFPVHLTATTRLYFERRAALEHGQLQADMHALAAGTADAAAIDRLSAVVETNILMRTTCTTTQIEGGHAQNALPQRVRATVQCRVLPGETPQSVESTLRNALSDPRIALRVIVPATPSPESPPAPRLLAALESVVSGIWPGVIVLPQMSAGATDSVFTRPLGLPSYGIDGMFDDLDDGRAHGRDERIGVAAFADEVEFTYRLMHRLAATPSL
ncbi:MAG: M20/M25/M40 family metallo-hydrolase [Proteobacteria bacterium]|nr:M20/M25/M40 family metallo-hydrolase [Pseudomonadota bacterium]